MSVNGWMSPGSVGKRATCSWIHCSRQLASVRIARGSIGTAQQREASGKNRRCGCSASTRRGSGSPAETWKLNCSGAAWGVHHWMASPGLRGNVPAKLPSVVVGVAIVSSGCHPVGHGRRWPEIAEHPVSQLRAGELLGKRECCCRRPAPIWVRIMQA
jgi:hypothetical protein